MGLTFPNESTEYRAARDRLLAREKHMRRLHADLADERGRLPPGGVILEDYVFERMGPGGEPEQVRMSELFDKDSLIVYSFMFGADRRQACGGCTFLLDNLDAAAAYIHQRANFVVVAGSPIDRLTAYARERGWMRHRLLSTAGNSYSRDYFGINPSDGGEQPMLNVFHRDGDAIRHFWGAEIINEPTEPGQDFRANDTIDAAWNMLDFIPEGRGAEWFDTSPE